jgi:hypothetical protein
MTRYSVSAKVMRYRKKDKWEKPLLNGKGFFLLIYLSLMYVTGRGKKYLTACCCKLQEGM